METGQFLLANHATASFCFWPQTTTRVASFHCWKNQTNGPLQTFNQKCPLLQSNSWKIACLTQKMKPNVFCTLQGIRLPLPLLTTSPEHGTGKNGSNIAPIAEPIPACKTAPKPANMSSSCPLLSGPEKAVQTKEKEWVLNQLLQTFATSPRRLLFWQGTKTPERVVVKKNQIFQSPAHSRDAGMRIQLLIPHELKLVLPVHALKTTCLAH